MVAMVWFLAYNHSVISYYYDLPYLTKTLVKLALKDISPTVYLQPSELSIEGSKKEWSLIKLLVPIPFLAIVHRHDTCICKQMSYDFRSLKMIGFPHYHFIEITGVQADPKFQVAKLVLPPNKHKAVNPWGGFMYLCSISLFMDTYWIILILTLISNVPICKFKYKSMIIMHITICLIIMQITICMINCADYHLPDHDANIVQLSKL